VFTEPLPSNDGGYTDKKTEGRDMKYADEMGSYAMIYIPSFINTGSVIQKLTAEYTGKQTAW
jgi:hypothetical protein